LSLAAFIASQRTEHRVPHAVACRAMDVSESWFYKRRDREPTVRQRRRAALDAKVAEIFADSGGEPGTYGMSVAMRRSPLVASSRSPAVAG